MRKIFSTLLFFIMTFLSIGCSQESEADPVAVEKTAERIERPDPVDEIINSMSLTEKIGQMAIRELFEYRSRGYTNSYVIADVKIVRGQNQ